MPHVSAVGDHESLRRYWACSMSTAGADSSSGAIEELLQRWSEPHRAYHTTQHLVHRGQWVQQVRLQLALDAGLGSILP